MAGAGGLERGQSTSVCGADPAHYPRLAWIGREGATPLPLPRVASDPLARREPPSLLVAMATLEELGTLPPITLELELFDYVPLDSPREPPAVEVRARLARRYEHDEDDDAYGEGLRVAFVIGRPVDSYDLLVLAYLLRAPPKGVAWGVERWPSPERRLRLYRHDPTFEPRAAADVHDELQSLGAASLADYARRILGS